MPPSATPSASLLLYNGLIHTMRDDAQATSCAIRFSGGRVDWVGGAGDLLPSADLAIDLRGRTVLPGLIDAHAHLLWIAQDRLQWNLAEPCGPSSIAELLQAVRDRRRTFGAHGWVVGVGLSEFSLRERRLPTREELDRVSSDAPVVLRRACGHAAVANSRALRLIGIHDDTPNPPGGEIVRSAGIPNGILRESAAFPLYARLPRPAAQELVESLRAVGRECLARGLTTVVEAAVGFSNGFASEWDVWSAVRETGGMPLRMGFMLRLDPVEARLRGMRPDLTDPFWQVQALKFFSDGVLGGQTAALHLPYCQCAGRRGLLMQDEAALHRALAVGAKDGWQLAVHAIGDKGIDVALEALAAASRQSEVPHRIEHLGLPSLAAKDQLRALEVAVVSQFSFVKRMGASFAAAVGPARALELYPMRSLLARGIILAGSSDVPAGALCPFESMAAAIDRRTAGGEVIGAHEAIGIGDALWAYTRGGAAAIGSAGQRGTLVPGAWADAIVIDRSPVAESTARLACTQVDCTIVNGRIAWARESANAEHLYL